MLRRLRENGPVVLVPAAWTVVTAAHFDLVATRPLLIAHLVMDVFIIMFLALSWTEMRSGALRAWLAVLALGLPFTLLGTWALTQTPPVDAALLATVVAWMILPAGGLAYTGRLIDRLPRVYDAGAALSTLGTLLYLAWAATSSASIVMLGGLGLVGVGHTVGILAATVGTE